MSERCPLLDTRQGSSHEIPMVCLDQCFDLYDKASSESFGTDDTIDQEIDCDAGSEVSGEYLAVSSLRKRRYIMTSQCTSFDHYPHQLNETEWTFDCPNTSES